MNLFKFHSSPNKLNYRDLCYSRVPILYWHDFNKSSFVFSFDLVHFFKRDQKTAFWFLSRCFMNRYKISDADFEEAKRILEHAFYKSAILSLFYAQDVITDRFILGEEAISTDEYICEEYVHFLKTIGIHDAPICQKTDP